eukprot:CAMPEP_0174854754 /NCGR_PEP_ID=MMETSP1114-20130205/31931_1 /TAXON_ID=312471 /ORGANISM="Neobodo designis, Strain CCAP 1951/1" /LENGTH=380 /DNA_ID=CAMNT_0016089463 /DNA_START=29 /DNA_END=1171 /DNA_ORIENTATION=+
MTTEAPRPCHRLILDHDGGVDDLAAQVVLGCAGHLRRTRRGVDASLPDMELVGVVAIDADCFVEPAAECSVKTAALCRIGDELAGAPTSAPPVQVGLSNLTCPGPEPFPDDWRLDSIVMNSLACLNSVPITDAIKGGKHVVTRRDIAGQDLLAELVMAPRRDERDSGKTIICVTGPLSNVAYCLNKYGSAFADRVDRVVIMGGAFDVKGNVFRDGRDGTAEWNIYWDPAAAKTVVETPLLKPEQKVFFALDATNDVPVSTDFVARFGGVTRFGSPSVGPTQLAHFLGDSWSRCTGFAKLFGDDAGYYAWDALTAAYVVDPTVCEGLRSVRVVVDTDPQSPSCGRTKPVPSDEEAGGVVTAAVGTRAEAFYKLMLDCATLV